MMRSRESRTSQNVMSFSLSNNIICKMTDRRQQQTPPCHTALQPQNANFLYHTFLLHVLHVPPHPSSCYSYISQILLTSFILAYETQKNWSTLFNWTEVTTCNMFICMIKYVIFWMERREISIRIKGEFCTYRKWDQGDKGENVGWCIKFLSFLHSCRTI